MHFSACFQDLLSRAEAYRSLAPHRYPTRFQAKLRLERERAADKALMTESVGYVKHILNQIHKASTFDERVEQSILLFEHLYEVPILLESQFVHFRRSTWDKMNEMEATLLSKLQTMPARLAANNTYDMNTRVRIAKLLDIMETLRTTFW